MKGSGTRMTGLGNGNLVDVTVKVHRANVDRIKAQAELWQVDASSVDPALWHEALGVANGDRMAALSLLESVSITFGWQRLIDVARSGEEGLKEVRDHLGRIAYGIHT